MTATEPVTWTRTAHDFYRSDCGRFDLVLSAHLWRWVAFDWDLGTRYDKAESLVEAQDWCASQPEATRV